MNQKAVTLLAVLLAVSVVVAEAQDIEPSASHNTPHNGSGRAKARECIGKVAMVACA